MHQTHETTTRQSLPTGALATFVAVVRHGTVSAAAQELHLSQPAVSRRLQGLEEQIGIKLFDRIATKLQITAAGTALLPHAERSLAAEADAVKAAQDQAAGPIGTVSIAVVGSLIDPLLTNVLRAIVQQHQGVELHLSTATSAQVCSLVRRGEATLGISYAPPTSDELDNSGDSDDSGDLHCATLMNESLVAICSPTHSMANRTLTAGAIRSQRWLVFPEQPNHPESSSTIARRTLEQHHVTPAALHPVDSLNAQRALVLADYGLALLPKSMVASDLENGALVHLTSPSIRVDSPVTLATRTGAYLPPAASAVVEILRREATIT